MTRVALTMLLLIVGAGASAGAWMREEGSVFVVLGANGLLSGATERPVHYDPTIFAEFGLSEGITLGFDGYTADAARSSAFYGFLRFPVPAGQGAPLMAVELAGGVQTRPGQSAEPRVRAGLSMGLGLENGWLAADASLSASLRLDRPEGKLDLTWGRRLTPAISGVLQLQTGTGQSGDLYAKLAPSAHWQIGGPITLELGVVQALTGDMGTGVRIGTHLKF